MHDCAHSNIVLYGSSTNRLSNTKILNCISYNSGDKDCFAIHKDDSNNNVGSNHLIRNCIAYNSAEDGFDITAGNNIVVENCETYGNDNTALIIGHNPNNVTIKNCYFHDEDYCGLYIGDGHNIIIRNNVIYNTASALITFDPTTNMLENCTVYNNDFCYPSLYIGTTRIVLINNNYFKYLYIKNNIFNALDVSTPDKLYRVYSAVIPSYDNVIFDTNIWYHGSSSNINKWYNGLESMSLDD